MPTKFENMIMDRYINTVYGPADDFTQMATEMAGGTEPEGTQPMSLRQFGETIADVPAGLLKGAVQGTVGLPGDIESLTYGVRELINRGANESMLDAFVRGIETKTILPTTENVKQWLDTNVGPLVPEGADPRRVEAAKTAEFVGELGGAGKTVIEGTRAAARGARQIGREMVATAPTGQVQLAPTPVQAPRSELGFYSAVEETVANLPQAKGTGQQFLAQISKTAGVKPEEIQWTGLDEFLKSKQSVTKQEIQDYLRANRVDVQEVQLGVGGLEAFKQQEKLRLSGLSDQDLADELGIPFGARQQAELADPVERSRAINNSVERNAPLQYIEGQNDAPKFSHYTLPGGENYREILLTLPQKTAPFDPSNVKIYRNRTSATQGTFTIKYGDNAVGPFQDDFNVSDNYAGLSDQQIIDVARRMYEQGNELSGIKPMSGAFKSTHFDQPNILAHLRVNDRTVDGKKTLFVEEIQSDWHQAGRKKGYGPQTETTHEAYYTTPDGQKVSLGFGKTQEEAAAAVDPGWQGIVDIKFDTQTKKVSEGVPDAPFKTSWHELSLKRAIQEAAEKGYDQIAFTTGKTQAERYDLSKQVDSIVYAKENDGTYSLVAMKDGRELVKRDSVVESALPNLVGKEVAERMAASEGKSIFGGPERELSGENLRVGGEGMKGFYDNILPKSLDKLGKKFGAKVGKTEMDGVEVWQMDITPKMRESVVSKGQPLFVAPIAAPGMMQQEETK